jgi:hypothetical protein
MVDPAALAAVASGALAAISFGPLEAMEDDEGPRVRTTLTADLRV